MARSCHVALACTCEPARKHVPAARRQRSLQAPAGQKNGARPLATRPEQRGFLVILSAQPRFAGSDDRLSPVGHLQFGEYVRDMVAYGLGADKEACGDRGVVVASGDEVQDLALAGGELGKAIAGDGGLGVEKKSTRRWAISGPK